MWKTGKAVLDFLGHVSTVAWLLGLAGASVSAAKAISVMPGGWLENPFVPLSWFFSTLTLVVLCGRGIEWGWARLHPLSLTVYPHGGGDVSLVLCPSESGDFYGVGWMVGPLSNRRQRPFRLSWGPHENQYKRIRGGDKTPVMLAETRGEDRTNLKLVIHGHGEVAETWDLGEEVRTHPSHEDGYFKDDLPWISVRVELRAKQFPNIWKYEYRFRLTKHAQFEIEEVKPSASRTAAPSP